MICVSGIFALLIGVCIAGDIANLVKHYGKSNHQPTQEDKISSQTYTAQTYINDDLITGNNDEKFDDTRPLAPTPATKMLAQLQAASSCAPKHFEICN